MNGFSDRHGYTPREAPITVRQEAPYDLRGVILRIAKDSGLSPSNLREIVCDVLRKRQNPDNWSEYPNILREVQDLVDYCEWYRVYDIIEEIYKTLEKRDYESQWLEAEESNVDKFAQEINNYFRSEGIGWQLKEGLIEVRGTESFELVVNKAKEALEDSDQDTASREMHEALLDLSRRPDPDITGAIQHAMVSLECVARDVCGNRKATLGDILKRSPILYHLRLTSVFRKLGDILLIEGGIFKREMNRVWKKLN